MTTLLDSLRVLDLTDHKGFFCGKILADLGADVIKIEKPGGDPARHLGPFYGNAPDPEKNLHWFAYNLNKRSITLDIETAEGKTLFKKLVQGAHFVIESYPAGYLDEMGLGYTALSAINPRIIVTSITPFGHTGPYKDYKGSDIVCMAMGGLAYITGNAEDSPLRVSFPQSYLLASAEAAAATMIAHYYRETTGQGQHVDVSIQASVAGKLANAIPTWELSHTVLKREGSYMFGRGAKLRMRLLWPCKDGYVTFALMGGKLGAKSNEVVARWIVEEGMAPGLLQKDRLAFPGHGKADPGRPGAAGGGCCPVLCQVHQGGDLPQGQQRGCPALPPVFLQGHPGEHPAPIEGFLGEGGTSGTGSQHHLSRSFPQGLPDTPCHQAARTPDR